MKKLLIPGISLLLVLFGCSLEQGIRKQPVFMAETFTLNGKLLFGDVKVEQFGYPQGRDCAGRRGYDDINGNISIVVKDGTGNIVATGKTESGTYKLVSSSPDGPLVQCIFSFYPITLPKSDFYVVSLANRGSMTFSFEDLKNKNWTVEFALGGN
jgi:hypothetical protein